MEDEINPYSALRPFSQKLKYSLDENEFLFNGWIAYRTNLFHFIFFFYFPNPKFINLHSKSNPIWIAAKINQITIERSIECLVVSSKPNDDIVFHKESLSRSTRSFSCSTINRISFKETRDLGSGPREDSPLSSYARPRIKAWNFVCRKQRAYNSQGMIASRYRCCSLIC